MPQGGNTTHCNACGGTGVVPYLPAASINGLVGDMRGPAPGLPPIPNFSALPSVAAHSPSAQAGPYTAGPPAGMYHAGQGYVPSAAFAGGYRQAHGWPAGLSAGPDGGAAAQTAAAVYARPSASVYPGGERGPFLGHPTTGGPGYPVSAHNWSTVPVSGQPLPLSSPKQLKRAREEPETPPPAAARAGDTGYYPTSGGKVEAESEGVGRQDIPPTTTAGTCMRPSSWAGRYMHNATVGGSDSGPAGSMATERGTTAAPVEPGLFYSAVPRTGWGPIPLVNTSLGAVPGPGSVLPLPLRSPWFAQGQKEHRYVSPGPLPPNPYKRARGPRTPWSSSTSSRSDYIDNDARRGGGVSVASSG